MKYLKNPKIWLSALVILFIVFAIVLLNFLGSNSEGEGEKTETTVPVAMNENSSTESAEAVPQEVTINATKLATNYFVYDKSEFEKAKAANRPILLFFYANWCPTCARQEPINVATFNSLSNSNVIAFRVNFNDSDTSVEEEALAEQFGVTYQHTFFTLNSKGEQVEKFLGDTSSEKLKNYLAEIN